jgi:hypothetical protein
MKWNHLLLAALLAPLASTAFISTALADRVELQKPIYTQVYTKAVGDARSIQVSGLLLSYDDRSITVRNSDGSRDFDWIALTPTSAFTLRSRLIDKSSAADWLALGKFGWSINAREQARVALSRAQSMDASLKPAVADVLATAPGAALQTTAQNSSQSDSSRPELIGPASATQPAGAPVTHAFGMMPRPPEYAPDKPTERFQKSTEAQDAMAIALAQLNARQVASQFNVTFQTLQTPHFLIFTDWDPREFEFLKTNFEDAYTAVSQQFQIPATDNVFVGKLPVYMFAHFNDFARLTDSIGFLGKKTPRTLRGYYEGNTNGSGRMVMYKPGADDVSEAERQWAHCLVHEFTHAFVARYRTNARVPRWLNEGIAEVIAAKDFSFPGTYPFAIRMANLNTSADALFEDNKMPSGEWYPVMQTLVEYLISQDHAAFKNMFDAIKDGQDGQAALEKYFHLNYHQLYSTWRDAILHR